MKQQIFKIITNREIASGIYKMVLFGNTEEITASGQFVNIKIDGFYLRRPISICDYDEKTLTLIYRVVGGGTEALSKMTEDMTLDLLISLGNGYNTECSGENPVLIGGGIGVPPLYNLCKRLVAEGKKPAVIMGFRSADEVFYEDEFKALGARVFVATADGSYGTKGFVTDVLKDIDYTYFYTCGPEPMFKAIDKIAKTSGQYSFEERMGCGFGACMGCSCKTLTGNKRICKEGPVMVREEIIWKD